MRRSNSTTLSVTIGQKYTEEKRLRRYIPLELRQHYDTLLDERRRSFGVAFWYWLLGGWCGAQWIYLRRWDKLFVRLLLNLTFFFGLFAWMFDIMVLPYAVDRCNEQIAHEVAFEVTKVPWFLPEPIFNIDRADLPGVIAAVVVAVVAVVGLICL